MEKKPQEIESCSKNQVKSTRQSHRMHNLNSGLGANSGGDDSESLSHISDAEVFKYLNNKEEARYKRIIWEVMNRDYEQGKSQKRAKTTKKADLPKEVVKPSRKINTEKRLSSKINYDMLKKLEHEEVQEMEKGEDTDSHHGRRGDTQPNNEKINSESYSSAENDDDEFDYGNADNEDGGAIQDYNGITDYEIDDNGYGYEEEYDLGEY
ncbi:TFIIB transcription factor [Trema orientale]|uniref:TFIIB transcription factor n=1 Tax=Trema orientale TaxID=63057 RepID=A0A2P5EAQ6_TREOI|nr:TFIIB transcription factor [Trema orientale]